ncbi:MAG: PleD family two-component system response regulator [Rhodospirillales bacterium]|jgi:two-component system chemotaxis response regulator CheY
MKSCLVVDGSKVIRMVTRRIVEGAGYGVREAADPGAATAACGDAMPDLILLDWDLPGSGGAEVLRAVREMEGGGGAAVILCSSQSDPARISDALAAGADEYVMKPFDGQILRSKLELLGLGGSPMAAKLV